MFLSIITMKATVRVDLTYLTMQKQLLHWVQHINITQTCNLSTSKIGNGVEESHVRSSYSRIANLRIKSHDCNKHAVKGHLNNKNKSDRIASAPQHVRSQPRVQVGKPTKMEVQHFSRVSLVSNVETITHYLARTHVFKASPKLAKKLIKLKVYLMFELVERNRIILRWWTRMKKKWL